MQEQRSIVKEKLCEEIGDLPDEQLAELVTYVDHLKEQTMQKPAGPAQGLDARGFTLIYRCAECGYAQDKDVELPPECPSCQAPKEAFVLIEED